MKIKSQIVLPHVYVFTYPTQYELAMTFVRVQEFYESPKFRNKYFTLEEFIDFWSLDHGGSFTYPSMWNGFNVPGDVLRKWTSECSKNGDRLRDKEVNLLGMIGRLMEKEGLGITVENADKLYIIGVHKHSNDINSVIDHESAHFFYRMYPEYRKKCKELTKQLGEEEKENMMKTLTRFGYGKKVMPDEIQAYSSTGSQSVLNNHLLAEFKANFESFKKLVKESSK